MEDEVGRKKAISGWVPSSGEERIEGYVPAGLNG
jgi:hypothetical protein